MSPDRLLPLIQALGGVDWETLSSDPALTIETVAEAVLSSLGPAGLGAADGIALFVALNRLGVIKPGSPGEGQTHDTPHTGRR